MTNLKHPLPDAEHIQLGRVTSVFGIKGAVKVYSYTQPVENIFKYPRWLLKLNGQYQSFELVSGRRQGKVLVAQLRECQTREAAQALAGAEILLAKDKLPALENDEYYWHQLEGLHVFTTEGHCLGQVDYLIETGANDVLVIKPTAASFDQRERLLPWLPDQVILEVDLLKNRLLVDWDIDF